MDKTSSGIATAAAPALAAAVAVQPAEPATEKSAGMRRSAVLALVCALRVGVIALMASSIAPSAWRARGDPWELAVVAGPCVLLAAIFVCIHRAERRLTPESPPGERRRLHVAVWVLSTGIFFLVAYRVSLDMPAALVIVIWCTTSLVVLAFFYMLVVYKDQHQHYQCVDEVDADAADDGKPFNKIRPDDELV